MTRGESELINDLNEFVRQTADQIDELNQSTGIRPPPVVEVTEQTLDTTRFGGVFSPQPLAESEPGAGTPTTTPTGACCVAGDCSIQTEADCTGMSGFYQGDGTDCDPNPCPCTPCGDRMTATFSGVSDSSCLLDYDWPMGLTNSPGMGDTMNVWQAACDSGPFPNDIIPCPDFSTIGVTATCGSTGWSVFVTKDATTIFEADGAGDIPLGTPIFPNLVGDGQVTMSCTGEWGVCCACRDGGGTDCVCIGCTDPTGSNSHVCGMGQVQCETLYAASFDHAVWQGDPSACTPQPCAGTAPDC